MKRSRFTEGQIVSILKEADAGAKIKGPLTRINLKQLTLKNQTIARLDHAARPR